MRRVYVETSRVIGEADYRVFLTGSTWLAKKSAALHGRSQSSWGPRAPRLSSRRLLLTEAREILSAVVGVLETGIHFFRLLTQHNQRPILQSLLGRTGSSLYDTIHEKQALLPTWTNWRILTSLVTWMLVKPEVCLNIQGLLNIYIR